MAKYQSENEREFPDSKYDKEAFDRLYGDKDSIESNSPYSAMNLSIEERARYLMEHGYVDPTIDIKVVIAKLEDIDKKAKEENENKQNTNRG